MQPMYPGQPNSPQTELAAAIDDTQDTFEILNGDVLPDAPNLAVLGAGELAETIRYGQKSGNVLSEVERGFQGEAQSWQEGTKIARNFTSYDYDALRTNVEEIQDELENLDLSAENVTLDSPDFISTNVKDGMQELFQNVDSGKNNIAAAIVDMNQPASGSDTFPELAQKIRDISSDATATAGDILTGQDAYARGQKITGTIVRRTGNVNAQSISRSGTSLRLRPHNGHYPGDTANSVQITHSTIDPANIKAGVNFAGSGLIGTLREAPSGLLYWAGQEGVPFVGGYSLGNGSRSKEANRLHLYVSDWTTLAERTYVTNTPVNLDGIKAIGIEWEQTQYSHSMRALCVSTDKEGDLTIYSTRLIDYGNANRRLDRLDVSTLSGSYYIRVHAKDHVDGEASNLNLYVYRIFLMD